MVLLVPSPKVHFQPEISPVEVSVKLTLSGAVPLMGVAVKLALGARTETVTRLVLVTVLDPPLPVTVNATV